MMIPFDSLSLCITNQKKNLTREGADVFQISLASIGREEAMNNQ
jgi:hypothetical protein